MTAFVSRTRITPVGLTKVVLNFIFGLESNRVGFADLTIGPKEKRPRAEGLRVANYPPSLTSFLINLHL
jgi:hypothetical protein